MKKLFSLENLIYVAVFFLPAYLIKISLFGFPTNILEMLIALIFVGWILEKGYEKLSLEHYKKYTLPLFLIFLGLLISAIFNRTFVMEAGIVKGWFIFPLLFVFLASQVIEKKRIINVFYALYASAFFISAAALIFLFLGKITYDGRLEAFFNSPNYLAMYLAPALILLAQVQSSKLKVKSCSSKLKVFNLISGLIILIVFYFTYSYTAWVAVVLSLVLTSVIKNNQFIRNKTIPALFLTIILLFIFQINSEKLLSLKNYSRSSLESRIMIWNSAERILSDNWLIGIGPGNFQEKYLEYQKYYPPYLEWAVPHPHNLYLSFWLSGGILDLVGFLWLVGLWFRETIKKDDSLVKFIVLGIMLYILIHGLVDTTYFKNDLAVIFWLNFLVAEL
jgi:O-antigen ligase